MSRDYLTLQDILALHDVLLHRYGGSEGLRDRGAIESAVFRPQCGYYTNVIEEVCALMESLLINHPFVDGNKRTAFAACDVFLRINGYHLQAQPDTLFSLILKWLTMDAGQRFSSMQRDLQPFITKKN